MSRIRFAPLPDPHVCEVHDVEDNEAYDVPLDTESAKNPKLLFPFPIPGAGRKTSDASSSASSSMHSLTPTQSIDSTTAPPSKKNRLLRFLRPRPDKENALTRWSSTSSALSNATADSLFRTQSSNSFRGGNVRTPKKHPRRPSTAEGMLATLHTSRPQQRMLNGRVYGSKNLFASAPDKEPEFVEWGYGGMGSVRSQREFGGSVWGKVQSDLGAPEEDDGGGMAWVKRRKEERERKAREEEEKKRKEQEERKAQEEHDTRAVTLPMQDAPEEENEEDEDADGGHHNDSPDDDDDDALLAREASRTSRGAGVELVSRHHKS